MSETTHPKPKKTHANGAPPPTAITNADLAHQLGQILLEMRETNVQLRELNRHAGANAKASIKIARMGEMVLQTFADRMDEEASAAEAEAKRTEKKNG